MHRSECLDQIAPAVAAVQRTSKPAARSATNPHLRRRYATLADVFDACREALAEQGLAVTQSAASADGAGVTVTTTLLHRRGQWIAGDVCVPLEKPTAQAMGSAITYARRYGLSAMLGIVAEEDDDGRAATASAPHVGAAANTGGGAPGGPVMPFGRSRGRPLAAMSTTDLQRALEWARAKGRYPGLCEAIEVELHRRTRMDGGITSDPDRPVASTRSASEATWPRVVTAGGAGVVGTQLLGCGRQGGVGGLAIDRVRSLHLAVGSALARVGRSRRRQLPASRGDPRGTSTGSVAPPFRAIHEGKGQDAGGAEVAHVVARHGAVRVALPPRQPADAPRGSEDSPDPGEAGVQPRALASCGAAQARDALRPA